MPKIVHRLSSIVNRKKQFVPVTNNELRKTNIAGFTLIELMVVIAIIAIISAVGIVVYSSAQKSARISKRVQDLDSFKVALELYKSSTGGYPLQNGWACISTPLTALVPSYMPVLPSDPLDSGNPGGTNCYEYTSGNTTSEYKVRTKSSIYGPTGEMNSAAFAQQPTFIDPAKDGTPDCYVTANATGVVYQGWSVYSGSAVCDD